VNADLDARLALTVGQHTGLAAGEWHVHAWDLARSAAAVHRPTDPGTVAAARAVLFGPPAAGDPWQGVLISARRTPPAG
jgi:hypothetical protein